MDYSKGRIVIVEGGQACGKTTVTNILRERILYCNLYRLSGIKDKSPEGQAKIATHYISLMNYLKTAEVIPFTHVFDRTFTTETVYSRLSHTEYSFEEMHETLWGMLEEMALKMPVYYVVLLMPKEKLEQTICSKSNKPEHAGIKFEVEESLAQQKEFLKIGEKTRNIKYFIIDCKERSASEVADGIIKAIETEESK